MAYRWAASEDGPLSDAGREAHRCAPRGRLGARSLLIRGLRMADYPLIALLAALRMKYFWKKITRMMIGTALNIAPASTQFQFTP
jgi:hypothetical protein